MATPPNTTNLNVKLEVLDFVKSGGASMGRRAWLNSGAALSPTPCSIAGFWKRRDSEAPRPAPGALALEDGESGVYLFVYHVRRGFMPICRGVAAVLRYGASGGASCPKSQRARLAGIAPTG